VNTSYFESLARGYEPIFFERLVKFFSSCGCSFVVAMSSDDEDYSIYFNR
jgi:hypothetical protein